MKPSFHPRIDLLTWEGERGQILCVGRGGCVAHGGGGGWS